MSHENDKIKNSKRRYSDETAIKKQAKIAKAHRAPVEQEHRLHKRHAMDCGNPECYLCGNPRKTHKDKLTPQEKRIFQDLDNINDRKSNGIKNGDSED